MGSWMVDFVEGRNELSSMVFFCEQPTVPRPLLDAVNPALSSNRWLVLGIESSCDDTAAAVMDSHGAILAHRVASQTGLHELYGGVKPDVARDAHARAIESTVEDCLREAGVPPQQLTAIAVTIGPGLSLCLQVGQWIE